MRKLRYTEAVDLTGQLMELTGSAESPLANAILASLSKFYYRPLRRRMPSPAQSYLASHPLIPLDTVAHQLAVMIPEVRDTLEENIRRP